MKSYVMVTGGDGFIGLNLCEYLSKKYRVINIDNNRLKSNFRKNLGYKNFRCSIGNKKKISKILKKYKPLAIYNLAAESHVDNSIKSPLPFIKNNINETIKFLDVIRKNKDDLNKKFRLIHMSTDEVYGSINKSSKKLFKEESILKPNSPYSSSKAAIDLIIRSYVKTYSLPIIIVRCCNNFGPYQHYEKLIPKIIHNAKNKIDIPIYDKGMQVREWIYVKDTVKLLVEIFKKGKISEIYNIGSSIRVTNIFLVNNILKVIAKKNNQNLSNFSTLIKFVKDRPAHDFKYAVSTKKIGKIIKLNKKYNFINKLKMTINWYLKHL